MICHTLQPQPPCHRRDGWSQRVGTCVWLRVHGARCARTLAMIAKSLIFQDQPYAVWIPSAAFRAVAPMLPWRVVSNGLGATFWFRSRFGRDFPSWFRSRLCWRFHSRFGRRFFVVAFIARFNTCGFLGHVGLPRRPKSPIIGQNQPIPRAILQAVPNNRNPLSI